MLKELIDTYEILKKYIFIIDRSNIDPLIIKFKNENFYHLTGLHKTNIDMFIPKNIKTKDKKYKYIKKNVERFEKILQNQIKEKYTLKLRIETFPKILNLLSDNNFMLYDLHNKTPGSLYDGDYGLFKNIDEIYCLLGIIHDDYEENNVYSPQSWMANTRNINIVKNRMPKSFNKIITIPVSLYNNEDIQ